MDVFSIHVSILSLACHYPLSVGMHIHVPKHVHVRLAVKLFLIIVSPMALVASSWYQELCINIGNMNLVLANVPCLPLHIGAMGKMVQPTASDHKLPFLFSFFFCEKLFYINVLADPYYNSDRFLILKTKYFCKFFFGRVAKGSSPQPVLIFFYFQNNLC